MARPSACRTAQRVISSGESRRSSTFHAVICSDVISGRHQGRSLLWRANTMDGRVFGKNDSVAKIAKAFRLIPLESITLHHGPEKFDRFVDGDAWRDQAAKAGAVVTCAQIERVLIWSS